MHCFLITSAGEKEVSSLGCAQRLPVSIPKATLLCPGTVQGDERLAGTDLDEPSNIEGNERWLRFAGL